MEFSYNPPKIHQWTFCHAQLLDRKNVLDGGRNGKDEGMKERKLLGTGMSVYSPFTTLSKTHLKTGTTASPFQPGQPTKTRCPRGQRAGPLELSSSLLDPPWHTFRKAKSQPPPHLKPTLGRSRDSGALGERSFPSTC